MPNLFNKPVSSNFEQTYVSQFVPLPLQQFARAQSRQQETQDEEVKSLNDASDAAWKLSGIANEDNKYLSEIKNSFDAAANDLSSKDLTQRDNQDAAKSLVRGISRDKNLATIMSNKAKYDEYLKNKEEAIKTGNYHPANDNGITSIEDYAKSGGYKSGKSIDPTIYKYEDARPVQEQYFNNLRELGADQVGKIGETFYKFGYDGISEARIGKQAAAAINSYMSTPAAAQEGRVYDLGVRQGQINPKKISKQAYIFDNFLNAGMERAGMSFKTGRAEAETANAKIKKEEQNVWQSTVNTETPSTLTNGHKFDYDDKGEIKGSGRPWSEVWKESTGVFDFIKKAATDTRLNDEESKDASSILVGAKLNGVSPADYAKHYDKTSHMKVDKPLIGKALSDNNQVLFNGGAGLWSTLNVMNTETGEKNMNFQDAMKKVADNKGISLPNPNSNPAEYGEALQKMGVSIIGQANPNEFSLKPIIFTVGNNKFAADMTFGGKNKPYKTKAENDKAEDLANLDRLQKGQQVIEKDKDGNDIIWYKDIKTGKIVPKMAKDL